jgi:8-oxo-dGTP diphosphatase
VTGAASDRSYPAYPLLGVSLAVFRGGDVLLASRTKPPLVGVFSLPGGLVETGESLESAALRELMEEVQVEAEVVGFVGHREVIDRDAEGRVRHHFVVATFAGRWRAGEGATGPEAGEIVWRAPERLGGLPTTPGLSALLARAKTIVDGAR